MSNDASTGKANCSRQRPHSSSSVVFTRPWTRNVCPPDFSTSMDSSTGAATRYSSSCGSRACPPEPWRRRAGSNRRSTCSRWPCSFVRSMSMGLYGPDRRAGTRNYTLETDACRLEPYACRWGAYARRYKLTPVGTVGSTALETSDHGAVVGADVLSYPGLEHLPLGGIEEDVVDPDTPPACVLRPAVAPAGDGEGVRPPGPVLAVDDAVGRQVEVAGDQQRTWHFGEPVRDDPRLAPARHDVRVELIRGVRLSMLHRFDSLTRCFEMDAGDRERSVWRHHLRQGGHEIPAAYCTAVERGAAFHGKTTQHTQRFLTQQWVARDRERL